MDWNFKEWLAKIKNAFLQNPYIISVVVWIVIMAMLPFWAPPAENVSAKSTEVEQSAQPIEEPKPTTFPSPHFTREKLAEKFENGEWDGQLVRSTDGTHIASIDDKGELWIDCYDAYTSLIRVYPETFNRYDTVYLDGGVALNARLSERDLKRFDPSTGELEILLEDADIGNLYKVAPTTVRFIVYDHTEGGGTELYHLMEVGATGPAREIANSTHPIAVRAFADYPATGDEAEFWLLRHAYVTGVWSGATMQIKEIAKLLDVDLTKSPLKTITNHRNPDLNDLDYSHLNPESLARVDRFNIVIDNEAKYYIHATRPFLFDDIEYRKVKTLGWYGFVEIDDLHERSYWGLNDLPVSESPSVRISYAARPSDLLNEAALDLTTVSIALPYYDHYSNYAKDLEQPEDFVQNLEILDAKNMDNGLRAVAIGYCDTTDLDDPEANFTVFLSRRNSRFVALATNAVSVYLMGEYNSDHINGNYEAPYYDQMTLTVYGRERVAFLPDIFAFTNDLQLHEYVH